ncbi:MAG: MAPEG family protein [Rhodobacter sp.]|nr:MAPEG family protein [Rhodobacter sp.]
MPLAATPLYAGLLALLFIYLSLQVVRARTAHKVSVGDGGERAVVKAMRVQANCAEYVPIGLILLALAELQGMPVWLVHVIGAAFTAGRILHAYGFGATPQVVPARVWGMYLTVTAIALLALANIAHAVF